MQYVNLVVFHNSRYTDTYYTYGTDVPLPRGAVVQVPFNRGNRMKEAVVFETDVPLTCDPARIKSIASVDRTRSLTEESVETCIWMRRRYGIKYLDAVRCFLPVGKPAREGKEKVPLRDMPGERQDIEALTAEQTAALAPICAALDTGTQKNFLLHGVTGSGKTEVYLRAIARALELGKTALLLVPEIALTSQITDRLIGRFGSEKLAILHSKLTRRERFDEWVRIRSGQARVVVGARMAVFAPVEDLGLVILDEEHEATYKSDMTPKYETVDVALKRLLYYRGVLLLGSATPSVVSYQRAQEGTYQLLRLRRRYNAVPLPKVELVDMREELRAGNRTMFSGRLYRAMEETLVQGQQIILFLNRRGYSTFVSCRACGTALQCPTCGISLTYHRSEAAVVCHYCGRRMEVPQTCPQCGSRYLRYFGTGTEKVEAYTRELFPDCRIARLDLDTAKNSGEIRRILQDFSRGRTEILIGTQLVAKGLDFKNVGLVGVVAADVGLHIPDYRATERTFQLVTQVAGRAGRGEKAGQVIVQSYTPDNFALTTAAAHDYETFFRREIQIRQMMDYPPFSDLIQVAFTSDREEEARQTAAACRQYLLAQRLQTEPERYFSPRREERFKGQDSVRYAFLIKCPKGQRNAHIYHLCRFEATLREQRSGCVVSIDVNPYSVS